MTAVASFTIEGQPVVVGDLLISDNERIGAKSYIPGVGESTEIFPLGSGYTITGLRQKLEILRDDIVIAWSGKQIDARSLINDTRNFMFGADRTIHEVFHHVNTRAESNPELSIIMLGIDANTGFTYSGSIRSLVYQTPTYGRVHLAGVGANQIAGFMHHLEGVHLHISQPASMLPAELIHAAVIATRIIAWDLSDRRSLLTYFGGGCEISYVESRRWVKLNDIAYMFWSAKQLDGGLVELHAPSRLFYYSYFEDVLCIHAMSFKYLSVGQIQLTENKRYIIDPVSRNAFNHEVARIMRSKVDYTPKYLSHFISIRGVNNQLLGQIQSVEFNDTSPLIHIDDEGQRDKIAITFNPDLFSRVIALVNDRRIL